MRGGEMEMTPPFCFLFTPNINYNALLKHIASLSYY